MSANISDAQAAEYLEVYTSLAKLLLRMKNLGYSKTELKKEVDLAFR